MGQGCLLNSGRTGGKNTNPPQTLKQLNRRHLQHVAKVSQKLLGRLLRGGPKVTQRSQRPELERPAQPPSLPPSPHLELWVIEGNAKDAHGLEHVLHGHHEVLGKNKAAGRDASVSAPRSSSATHTMIADGQQAYLVDERDEAFPLFVVVARAVQNLHLLDNGALAALASACGMRERPTER